MTGRYNPAYFLFTPPPIPKMPFILCPALLSCLLVLSTIALATDRTSPTAAQAFITDFYTIFDKGNDAAYWKSLALDFHLSNLDQQKPFRKIACRLVL